MRDSKRFWSKVGETPIDGCWEWVGAKTPKGYGQFWYDNRLGYAHRWSYEQSTGPIPSNYEVDHLCHNPPCVRPDHLNAATHSENQRNLSGPQRNNRTGFLGVVPNHQKFAAMVSIDGSTVYLGTFDTAEEAAEVARIRREQLYAASARIRRV